MLDLKRLALVTCVTNLLVGILSVQQVLATFRGSFTMRAGVAWLAVPLLLIALVWGTAWLGFFWCIYRNEVPLFIPRKARLAAFWGAIVTGVMVLVALPSAFRDFGAFALTARVVTFVDATAYILLLIALFRRPSGDSPAGVAPSRELRYLALSLAIGSGIWVVVCLLRLAMWPSIYRNMVLQVGPHVPSVWIGVASILRDTMRGVSMFAAPYAVYLICVFMRSDDTGVVREVLPGSTS